jgi:hypothetical protein
VDLYIHSPIRLHGIVLHELGTGTTLPYLTVDLFPSYNVDCLPHMDRVYENCMSELHASHSKMEFIT